MLDRLVTPTDARAPRTYGISLVGPHTRAFEAEHKTKQKVRRRGQWLRHAAGSDELPDGPPPHAWVPARPMSNKSPGVTPRPWNWSPTAEPQRKVTSANKGDKWRSRS